MESLSLKALNRNNESANLTKCHSVRVIRSDDEKEGSITTTMSTMQFTRSNPLNPMTRLGRSRLILT